MLIMIFQYGLELALIQRILIGFEAILEIQLCIKKNLNISDKKSFRIYYQRIEFAVLL